MRRMIILCALGAMMAAGCKKEPPPEPEKKEAPVAPVEKKAPRPPSVKLPQLAPAAPKTKVDGPATSADYEEEAAKTVHFENLEAELDRLEAEITGG